MKSILFIGTSLLLAVTTFAQQEKNLGWPREVEKKDYSVVFYQPQLESLVENILEGRMAITIKRKEGEPVFGAVWFNSRIDTDFEQRLVYLKDITFTNVKFPDIQEDNQKALRDMLTREIGKMEIEMTLDRLMVSLDITYDDNPGANEGIFENTPPDIYFRTGPVVLVMIDGDPILNTTSEPHIQKVLNTPYFLVLYEKKNKYYLKGGSWWYESEFLDAGWTQIKKPPRAVIKYNEKARNNRIPDSDTNTLKDPPEIIISTKPAELITSNGAPVFSKIENTGLVYLSNSENDVIEDVSSQQYYTLISGRWFRSSSLENIGWSYVNPRKLPADFKNIPSNSPIANVRSSIPGTSESREAILQNSIPQTAEIDKKTATITVNYDGEPRFEQIRKMNISYAVNTDKSVLLVNRKYYCADQGVWFEASAPRGPWRVCENVPDVIYDIPPSSPVYNVTYVRVYDSTPDFVYVGYTPGYYGSYVSYGTIIYGTGYRYSFWHDGYYYPRPVTYGYGVHYNPYTGWGYSVGLSYGWIYYDAYPYYWGYWGPSGYRYGYRYGYSQGYHIGYRNAINSNRTMGSSRTYRGAQSTYSGSGNIYRNRTTGVRSTRGTYSSGTSTNRTSSTVPQRSSQTNNVYTDRSGNVYRRQENGSWQQRNNSTGQWQSRTAPGNTSQGTRSGSTPGPQNRSTTQPNLSREYNMRDRGTTRSSNYNQYFQRSGTGAPAQRQGTTTPPVRKRN